MLPQHLPRLQGIGPRAEAITPFTGRPQLRYVILLEFQLRNKLGRKCWKTKQSSAIFAIRFFVSFFPCPDPITDFFRRGALHVWVAARDEDFVGQHHHWTPFWCQELQPKHFPIHHIHQVISCLSLLEFRSFSKGKLQRCVHPFQLASGCIPRPKLAQPCTVPLPRYCEAKDASTSSCHRKLNMGH